MSGDWIDPLAILMYRDVVRLPEFAEVRICSVCAIACGAEWQHNDDWGFEDGECPCCGRKTSVAVVKKWKWRQNNE